MAQLHSYCVKSLDSVVGHNTELLSIYVAPTFILGPDLPIHDILKGKELDRCGKEDEAGKDRLYWNSEGPQPSCGMRLCTQGAFEAGIYQGVLG